MPSRAARRSTKAHGARQARRRAEKGRSSLSFPLHRPAPRAVSGGKKKGRGVAASALLFALIHRSAWKMNSRKFPWGDSPESSTRNGAGHHTVFGGHLALPYQRESRRSQKVQRQHHQRVQPHPKNRAPGSEDQAVDVDAGE